MDKSDYTPEEWKQAGDTYHAALRCNSEDDTIAVIAAALRAARAEGEAKGRDAMGEEAEKVAGQYDDDDLEMTDAFTARQISIGIRALRQEQTWKQAEN